MNLPLVLAGPIVRRVTPEKVWIWIAVRELLPPPYLQLYEHRGSLAEPMKVDSEPEWYPVALGHRLWVYMLAAVPARPLVQGRTYEYDILLNGTKPLLGKAELRRISLKGFARPSIVPGYQDRAEMHALYGSCRKLHGPNPDMMKGAEQILDSAKSGARPTYFFLGGDQIYADDVHPALLPMTKSLRQALFGPMTEVIPGISPQALTLAGDRSGYLKSFFTSGEMEHHLLTFAEFATVYLMSWNGDLWEPMLRKSGNTMQESMQAPVLMDNNLAGGAIGARRTRKVFANMICYMIFDDHEVTDDWFLNEDWESNAAGHDAAIRILTNGMAAYWAFQGWGNDPQEFDDDYRSKISTYAAGFGQNTADVWSLLRQTDWSFMAPASPPVLFLDTRTRRESSPPYIDEVGYGFEKNVLNPFRHSPDILTARRTGDAPRLVNEEARLRITELCSRHARPNSPLIVIAPSPVFGFPPMEWVQSELGKASPAGADFESWAGNPRNLIDAMELFTAPDPHPLIILSGDVHYGFEVEGRIFSKSGSVPFLQLCSSALKNKVTGTKGSLFGFIAGFDSLRKHFRNEEISFAFWDRRKAGETDGPLTFANASHRAAEIFYGFYGGMEGDKDVYLMNSRFVKHSDRDSGKSRIEMENNLGEIIVTGNSVSHRHWYAGKHGETEARKLQTWDLNDWPVKDLAGMLLEIRE